jgi:RNA polymerase sigma-70 factor, ECF subfamily
MRPTRLMNTVDLLPVIVAMTSHPSGDPSAALSALYAEHGRALLAYAHRFTADRGRAEDIVQETFLRAWRHLPVLLEDGRPIRPWLFQVTRRLLVDAARAAQARPILADSAKVAEPVVDGGFDRVLDQRTLLAAMEHLSPAHQEIVLETFFLGTPLHVSAKRLGLPAGTARSRLHHALARLREHLDPIHTAA